MAIAAADQDGDLPAEPHQSRTTRETAWRGSAKRSTACPFSIRSVAGASRRASWLAARSSCVLLRVRRDGRAHALPDRVGVAVALVDPVVRQARLAGGERQPAQRQRHGRVGPGHVVVVIVPDHDAELLALEAGQRRDVGRAAHAVLQDRVERRRRRRSATAHALAAHLAEHAEDVEHRQVDAVGRQRAEAGEVRLVLELEGPGERALEVDAVLVGQVVLAREARGGVARVHRAVAIAELRPLAGGAAFGIGLADDDRLRPSARGRTR